MQTMDYLAFFSDRIPREIVPSDGFIERAILDPLFDGAIVGSGSVYRVKKPKIFIFEGNEFCGLPYTHQAIGRKILEIALSETGRKRYPGTPIRDESGLPSAPQYCDPGDGDFIYIDLRSAFWQIYQRMPLYPSRVRGRYNNAPPYLGDYLPVDLRNYKLVRNSIGGSWRASRVTRIKSGRLISTPAAFPTASGASWGLLQEYLHSIAYIAVQCGARYVNVDGYIFPCESRHEDFTGFLADNGFEYEIKAKGRGLIAGIGSYQIGGLLTKKLYKGTYLNKIDGLNLDVLRLGLSILQERNIMFNPLSNPLSARRADPRVSLFRQLDLVKPGIYLATYLFKPSEKYKSATIRTSHFSLYEFIDQWEQIRQPLLDLYKSGGYIAVAFDGTKYSYGEWEGDTDGLSYERLADGLKLCYPQGFNLFTPLESTEETDDRNYDDLPF